MCFFLMFYLSGTCVAHVILIITYILHMCVVSVWFTSRLKPNRTQFYLGHFLEPSRLPNILNISLVKSVDGIQKIIFLVLEMLFEGIQLATAAKMLMWYVYKFWLLIVVPWLFKWDMHYCFTWCSMDPNPTFIFLSFSCRAFVF